MSLLSDFSSAPSFASVFFLPQLHLAAQEGFSELNDPLEAFLTFLECAPSKQKAPAHTFRVHIVKEFQSWLKEHPQVDEILITLLLFTNLHVVFAFKNNAF